jgi:transcriptional regulator with XRE-family HTH domain
MNEEQEFVRNFGEHLKEIRLKKGFSQEILALDADIPVNQVGRIERAEIKTTLGTIYKLAAALQISPKELLDF